MTTTSTELSTRHASLPPLVAAPRGAGPSGFRWWITGAALVVLTAVLIAAATVPLPYTAIMPGSATPVSGLISVSGAASYVPAESIAFTTVTAREATVFEALRGWLDDEIDVLPNQTVRADRSEEENRELNQQMMIDSKLVARTVALTYLGYDVNVRIAGVTVRGIAEGSPAQAAGVEVGDTILRIDGEPVDEHQELGVLLQAGGVGAQHTITVERPAASGQERDIVVGTIGAEEDPNRAIIGIAPEELIVDFEFPIAVDIDSGAVGGPSAGLAFTLAVLDVLTEGELTGGHRVATTGTIELDGRVGPVGGAVQKAVTVRNAGYEVFLVPSDEFDVVEATVGGDLEVIAVDTLEEALDALESLGGNAASLEPA